MADQTEGNCNSDDTPELASAEMSKVDHRERSIIAMREDDKNSDALVRAVQTGRESGDGLVSVD